MQIVKYWHNMGECKYCELNLVLQAINQVLIETSNYQILKLILRKKDQI